MTDNAFSLSVVYQGWDVFQRDLLKAVRPLTPDQWALPVAPTHWPIDRLVQHIVADRAWWFLYGWARESPKLPLSRTGMRRDSRCARPPIWSLGSRPHGV